MKKRTELLNGALVVLPLQVNSELDLNPQPNFLVIENIFGLESVPFPDGKGGVIPTMCMNSLMKLQYKEIVDDEVLTVTYKEFNQYISLPLINLLQSKESLIAYKDLINTFLPMIKFKGFLADFRCRLDAGRVQEYIDESKEKELLLEESTTNDTEITDSDTPPLL